MKSFASLLLVLVFYSQAVAEMYFPEFSSLPPSAKASWGYQVKEEPSHFYLKIPKSAATFCTAIRLYIKDKEGRIISETNMSIPNASKDGSVEISSSLQNQSFFMEMILYTGVPPNAALFTNFGGFTFTTSKKAEQGAAANP